MVNSEFVERLNKAFGNETMARVAKRLKVPHATVRNYYLGRLPSPEVLIKIAGETGVSLNWLLSGTGDVYAGVGLPMDLGTVLEAKIEQIIDRKLAQIGGGRAVRPRAAFDVEEAVQRLNDPERIMRAWFGFEGREYPSDYGVVFFRGWETFSPEDKIAAVRDAKRVLDRSISAE
ncbi:MAG: helix-turn-helix domain-containing protein [Pyrinomonadaceae bacterium]